MPPTEEQRQRAREIGDWICRKPAAVSLEMTAQALQSEYEQGKRDGVGQAAGILEERAMRLMGGRPRVVKADRMLAGEFTYAAKEIREALGGSVEPAQEER